MRMVIALDSCSSSLARLTGFTSFVHWAKRRPLDRCRQWLLASATGLALASGVGHAAEGSATENHASTARNVLIIVVDDLNDSLAGFGGHPQAQTPHLDRLRRQATTFSNAHCSAPICGPSRASVWTGLLPSSTGYYGYQQQRNHWRKFPKMAEAITLMERLRGAGFQVGATGKVFHNGHEDQAVWSKTGAISGSGHPSDFGPWPWDGATVRWGSRQGVGHPRMPGPFASYVWDGFGPLSDIPQVAATDTTPGHRGWVIGNRDFTYRHRNDRDRMPDELNADWAAQRLQQAHQQPFMMVVGMNRPHAPRYAPDEYFERFPLADVQLPPYRANDLDDVPKVLWQNPDGSRQWQSQWLPKLLDAGGEEWWRRSVRSYLACVAFVDEQIGMVLRALANGPHAKDTLVIVFSDHGFHLGEKDNLKKTTLWEEVTRVPLIIAGPGVQADHQEHHPVSLVDIYPTVIDLLALAPAVSDQQLDGTSLRPFVENRRDDWTGPKVAISVLNGDDPIEPHYEAPAHRQHFSVRSERYRYTLCNDGSEELYDLSVDPHCWDNRFADPSLTTVKAALRQQLVERVFDGKDPHRP